jgi:hypothetical protein
VKHVWVRYGFCPKFDARIDFRFVMALWQEPRGRTRQMSKCRSFLVAAFLAAVASPAAADTMVKFYSGTGVYSGPFSGAGSVYQAIDGTATAGCGAGSSSCAVSGGDIFASPLIFSGSGAGITASSSSGVWWDLSPNSGGLGAGRSGDDQIEGAEILQLHFNSVVTLTGVATLFASGHDTFGSGFNVSTVANKDFLFCAATSSICTPSSQVTFGNANSADGILQSAVLATGTDFFFKEDPNTSGSVEFYVSGITYKAVPGPIAGAGLPGLIVVGGGLLGWMRRKRNGGSAIAA